MVHAWQQGSEEESEESEDESSSEDESVVDSDEADEEDEEYSEEEDEEGKDWEELEEEAKQCVPPPFVCTDSLCVQQMLRHVVTADLLALLPAASELRPGSPAFQPMKPS